MPTCPNGHESADEDYCDTCGFAMAAEPAVPAAGPAAGPAAAVAAAAEPSAAQTLCPACDMPLDGRFCEACGHDSLAAPPPRTDRPQPQPDAVPAAEPAPRRPVWTATVSADREYYDTVMAIGGPDAVGITFPPFCPERYFPLQDNQITIGRRSASRGITPGIDLTGPPEDSGVSHLHAMLLVQPDGTLSVVDLGSSNGTTVNSDEKPLRANVPRPLSTGDQIHLGAWTTITVQLAP